MREVTAAAEALANRCIEVAGLGESAISWIGDEANRDKVGAEVVSLRRELRRAVLRARKLAHAAKRNMCVGVYGPSQAGKSYLVSVLGRPPGGELRAAFDGVDEPPRYLDRINPEGQGESTGLVTRFTAAKVPAPPGFPVKVRFLSEPDLARILANAFAMDGDGSETPPTPEELERLLKDAEAKGGGAADQAFSSEDMWEVQEYVTNEFGRLAYFSSLRPWWERAAVLAPRLDPRGRAELLSVLWGRHAPLTKLFALLASHLKALGDAREVFVPLAALIPREESIIDVQTLKELDGEAELGPVEVCTRSGVSTTLRRGELTALASEMIVPMAEKSWDFLSGTDLLDFPGTRNRFSHDLASFLEVGEAPLAQVFLRGKVAYLFDRYVAEQELTSMLLCVGEGNMEAKDLPGLIDRWVAATHGSRPHERESKRCILFFVLTKFDTLLVDSGGSGDDPKTRFDRRIQNSMLEPFGKLPGSWLNEWAGRTPFRNTFWVRNPEYDAAVIERGPNGREVGVRADRRERVEALRAGAVESDLVQRHFTDPTAAWEAAMAIDDGGVTHLAGAISEVCIPEVKLEQVRGQLAIQTRILERRLSPFHASSDVESRLEQKRKAADELIGALDECYERNRWGELMNALVVDPTHIADEIARIPPDIYIMTGEGVGRAEIPEAGSGGGARPRPGRPRPGRPRPGRPDAGDGERDPRDVTAAPSGDSAPSIRRMTLEAFQAERSLTVWMEGLRAFLASPERLAHHALSEETASDLVGELIEASRRLGLDAEIRKALVEWNFSLHSERRAAPAAIVAAEIINRFLARLGMDMLPPSERPEVEADDGTRHVFAERPVQDAVHSLPERPRLRAEERFVDWTYALYRTFEDNARSVDGATVDLEQNMRLGRILAGLAADDRTPGREGS